MKNCFKVALATLALASVSSAARADLTINGAVGLPLNPTAQIPQKGGVRLQGNYYKFNGDIKEYGVVAATRVADGLEINGGYNKVDGGGTDDDGFAIGVKYLFSRESDPVGVRLAVGAGMTAFCPAEIRLRRCHQVSWLFDGRESADHGSPWRSLRRFRSRSRFQQSFGFWWRRSPCRGRWQHSGVGEIQSQKRGQRQFPLLGVGALPSQGFSPRRVRGVARQGLTRDGRLFAQIGYTFGG